MGWRLAVYAALLLAATAGMIRWQSPPDPFYHGKRLSQYLYEVRPGLGPGVASAAAMADLSRRNREADEAVKALGPEALPLLISWMRAEWGWREKLRRLAWQPGSPFYWLRQIPWLATEPRSIAVEVFCRAIPDQAGPVVRALCRDVLANSGPLGGQTAQLVVQILDAAPATVSGRVARKNSDFVQYVTADPRRGLNDPKIQVLSALLKYDPPADREAMVRRLWPFRRPHFNCVLRAIAQLDPDGYLRSVLYLESGVAVERPDAAAYFAEHPREPARVVPLLISNLAESGSFDLLEEACKALGEYGTNAAPAIPRLRALLKCRSAHVARAASNAVWKITAARPPP